MADETGDPERPYMGKRGPRRTPPPGHPDRKKDQQRRQSDNVVEGLFGKKALEAAEERRPKGKNPKLQEPAVGKKPARIAKRRKNIRIGEKWTAKLDALAAEGLTMEQFVKELTPEELARGQLKNDAGSFVGAPPKWVPAEFHKECIRELMRRGKTLYQENYIAAIQAMTTIATDGRVDPGQRIRAAQFVIERIEGKVPEKLEIGVSEPWQEMLVGIIADVPDGTPLRAFEPPYGAEDTEMP